MKLHVLSDLHLGTARMRQPLSVVGDALLLAGDITDGRRERLFELVQPYLAKGRPVLFTPGNHEFDGHSIAGELRELWRACRKRGVELLYNRCVVLDGIRFAGTTLWTDFEFENRPILSRAFAQQNMADFSWLAHRGRVLRPEATVLFHARARRFLERVFATQFAGPTVVMTHHAPRPKSIHKRFGHHPLNPGFVSDLTTQIEQWRPRLWIHGHVHNSFDYRVGATRMLANPRGRVEQVHLPDGSTLPRHEHHGFNPKLLIQV